MGTFVVNGIAFDDQEDAAAPEKLAKARFLILVPATPLAATQREHLAVLGCRLHDTLPGGGIVCRYDAADAAQKIATLPFVRHLFAYPVQLKLSPPLLGLPFRVGGVPAKVANQARMSNQHDASPERIVITLHRDVDPRKVIHAVAGIANVAASSIRILGSRLFLEVARHRLSALAESVEVRTIDQQRVSRKAVDVAREIVRVPNAPVEAQTLDGRGETICIADTGFDMGSRSDVHAAFTGRVHKLYAFGNPARADDRDGHGTHVAGIAVGNGKLAGAGPVCGIAPGARLVVQAVLGVAGATDDLASLLQAPYRDDRVRIHSNSWIADPPTPGYDAGAEAIDAFVYEHRDLVVCVAAGNEGADSTRSGTIDLGSICAPGTAKNAITVGASENRRPDKADTWNNHGTGDYALPIGTDLTADNPEGMAASSSRGPVDSGRLKPDLVAPGTQILSARSRCTASTGWGLSGDPLYMFDGGTSMATPLVAGCAAVVRQYLRKVKKIRRPSAALVKAALVNGAHAMRGQYPQSEAGKVPSMSQGFGRVDLTAVVGPCAAGETVEFFDEDVALDVGESEDWTVTIVGPQRQLKVTIVWTDAPGPGLQADLDLQVVAANGKQRNGNQPAGSAEHDRDNNVEQVVWNDVPEGDATVTIVAHRADQAPQDYAMVVRVR